MDLQAHTRHSTLRERIVEHVFVGEALRFLWCKGITNVEVLRCEFDAHGYDLVMARDDIVRHIQFKTGMRGKPLPVSVSTGLAAKPSGCVIWIAVTPELELGPYWWFGGQPGEPLPSLSECRAPKRIVRRATGERPIRQNHALVPVKSFKRLESLGEVLDALFGNLPEGPKPPIVVTLDE